MWAAVSVRRTKFISARLNRSEIPFSSGPYEIVVRLAVLSDRVSLCTAVETYYFEFSECRTAGGLQKMCIVYWMEATMA